MAFECNQPDLYVVFSEADSMYFPTSMVECAMMSLRFSQLTTKLLLCSGSGLIFRRLKDKILIMNPVHSINMFDWT